MWLHNECNFSLLLPQSMRYWVQTAFMPGNTDISANCHEERGLWLLTPLLLPKRWGNGMNKMRFLHSVSSNSIYFKWYFSLSSFPCPASSLPILLGTPSFFSLCSREGGNKPSLPISDQSWQWRKDMTKGDKQPAQDKVLEKWEGALGKNWENKISFKLLNIFLISEKLLELVGYNTVPSDNRNTKPWKIDLLH